MMRKMGVFIHVSLDGFFAGPNDEIDWFKVIKKDAEWEKHTYKEAQSGSTLLLGEKTYKMMKGFWPTPAGIERSTHGQSYEPESKDCCLKDTQECNRRTKLEERHYPSRLEPRHSHKTYKKAAES
jgi:hypothetical protein